MTDAHPIYPHALVTTEAVASVLDDPDFKLIEVDLDPDAYADGHLPGALCWDWERQLRDQATYDLLSPEQFAALLESSGIATDHKVILYGDNNNWFACWAYWMLHMFGHKDVWLMDGGTRKWFSEGRAVTQAEPAIEPAKYPMQRYDKSHKAEPEHIFEAFFSPGTHRLVDVRSSAEFEGKWLGPLGVEARCKVGGHIPTAVNIPWNLNCNADGTFKDPEELAALYASFDITARNTIITYCAIGERASLSWFVLSVLLGYPVVMNYDRSMAQWTRLANAPLVQSEAA